jgi:hypothetical protein
MARWKGSVASASTTPVSALFLRDIRPRTEGSRWGTDDLVFGCEIARAKWLVMSLPRRPLEQAGQSHPEDCRH